MNYLIVALAILLFICFCGTREGFVDFGLSGYHKPVGEFSMVEDVQDVDISSYKRDITQMPVSVINDVTQVVQSFIRERTGKCLQPIETIYVNKYSGETGVMYDTRFMFYDPKHFFVSEIMARVLKNNKSDTYTISSVRTQVPSADQSGPSPYGGASVDTFVSQPEILSAINPSNDALEAVSKALEQNKPQE